MLCESPEKLNRRLDHLRRVASQGVLYSVQDLIHVRSRPQSGSLDAFNGQSIAMVNLLLERGTPQQCLEFVEASREKDWKAVLRDVYSERSDDLERSMSDYVRTDREIKWARYSSTPALLRIATFAAQNSLPMTQ